MKTYVFVLCIILLFYILIYLPVSLFFSAVTSAQDHERTLQLSAQVENDLDLKEIFNRHGMEFFRVRTTWAGKTYVVSFYVKDTDNIYIPPEIINYIENTERISKRYSVLVEVIAGETPESRLPDLYTRAEKRFFWWRLLY